MHIPGNSYKFHQWELWLSCISKSNHSSKIPTMLKSYSSRNTETRFPHYVWNICFGVFAKFQLNRAIFEVWIWYKSMLVGRTPLNTVPILSCVKAFSKNRHFRVFIMSKIGQTHVFLEDYVHIHQMGSHFVGGYQLDFSPTEQESKTSILQGFNTR